jgi:hypothetical protein
MKTTECIAVEEADEVWVLLKLELGKGIRESFLYIVSHFWVMVSTEQL